MILPLMIAAALDASPAGETPKAYMARLYANYLNPSFNPLTRPARFFTKRLVAALDEDSRLADGEVGYLDGDPICQCQAPDGLNAAVTDVIQDDPGKARVRVSIGVAGYEARPATFNLVLTNAGWRIADVSSPDEPSLLLSLEESNSRQRAKH